MLVAQVGNILSNHWPPCSNICNCISTSTTNIFHIHVFVYLQYTYEHHESYLHINIFVHIWLCIYIHILYPTMIYVYTCIYLHIHLYTSILCYALEYKHTPTISINIHIFSCKLSLHHGVTHGKKSCTQISTFSRISIGQHFFLPSLVELRSCHGSFWSWHCAAGLFVYHSAVVTGCGKWEFYGSNATEIMLKKSVDFFLNEFIGELKCQGCIFIP